jgi:protein SCO1/2
MRCSPLAKKILLSSFLLLVSCNIKPTYTVTGVILEKDLQNRIMLIDHDKIKGFMDPMIMNFKIHNSVEMDNINILDSVKFDLVILDDGHYSLNFKKLGLRIESDNIDILDENYNDSIYSKKNVGEAFDNVSFTQTDSNTYNLYESNKDYTIISYIFTRCPMPEMCPAVISKNTYLASSFKKYDNIEFLLISFDYIFDTADILLENYSHIENNHKNLKFLSSQNHYNDLILLTKQSNISFGGVEDNNIGHTMRTIILDKNYKLIKAYDGLDWKPGDLKNFLINYIELSSR